MLNQSHGIPEPGINGQRRGRHNKTLHGNLWAWSPTFPGIGVPMNNGRLILEAGDNWGDEVAFAADVEGDG